MRPAWEVIIRGPEDEMTDGKRNVLAVQVMVLIGRELALLHAADIIHGDLTTSNMIYVPCSEVKKLGTVVSLQPPSETSLRPDVGSSTPDPAIAGPDRLRLDLAVIVGGG